MTPPHALTWTHDPHAPVPSSTDIGTFWYLLAGYPDKQVPRGPA
ncbi:hypothetical protein [Streptomyces acidiscabies]|nr:hypothetical protein [Streptomyces acidiscabies]